jgi:hypothetical protein
MEPTKSQAAWFNKLKKLLDDAPDGVWLYLASGTLCMMAKGRNGERVHDSTFGVDQEFVLDQHTSPKVVMDGGDW